MINNKKTYVSILFVLISFVCSAQMPPPPQPPPGPVGLPIDNGIVVLLITGVLFGIYKIHEFKKKAI